MLFDLRKAFSLDSGDTATLDDFIAERLVNAGIWESLRRTDGIPDVRLVEHEPARVSVCGRLYEIDQTEHPFWVKLEHEPGQASVTWSLYFDVIANSARRAQRALDLHNDPDQIKWLVALTGSADVVGKRLSFRP